MALFYTYKIIDKAAKYSSDWKRSSPGGTLLRRSMAALSILLGREL